MGTCIFYTNGIDNSFDSANEIRRQIETTFKTETRLVYNGATRPQVVRKLAADTAAGVATGLCAVAGAITTAVSAVLAPPLAPIAATATAGHAALFLKTRGEHQHHLYHIQQDKKTVGKRIAAEVREFFRNGGTHAVLVGHSQGAQAVHIASKYLKDLKDRISIITIGGLVAVCPHRARCVHNIVNEGDRIAWATPAYQEMTLKGLAPDLLPSCSSRVRHFTPRTRHLGHGAEEYLNNPDFLRKLLHSISG